MLDVPDHEVGALAGRQRAAVGAGPSARAACTVTPRSASSGVRRNSVQAMFSISSSDSAGRRAGVVVGGDRDRHAGGAQRGDRRQPRLAQEVERAGQQHGHACRPRAIAATPSSLRYSRWSHDSAPYSRGERGAALVAQLLGVQLDRQAERARGVEHAPRLRRREADALAERVDRVDQPFGVQRRQPARRRRRCSRRRGRRTPAAARAPRGRWCAPSAAARGRAGARRAGSAPRARATGRSPT